MTSVVGVRFKKAGKMYYFAPGQLAPAAGEYVIVETARGEECGEVVKPVHEVPDSKISKPLRPALRMADDMAIVRQYFHGASTSEEEPGVGYCNRCG